MADALGSMGGEINSYKRNLLEAAATGGSAGIASFKAGQEALAAERQASVGRAASRAALIGGPEAQGFEVMANDQYGRGIANLGTARTTFEADMSRRLAANQDYLSKAAAAIPAYRAQTDRIVGLKEASAKTSAASKAADSVSIDELLGLASQAQERAKPTGPVDFGKPQQPGETIEQYLARLNTAAQGRRDSDAIVAAPVTDVAAKIGRGLGLPETKVAGLYAPGKVAAVQSATQKVETAKLPEAPDATWIAKNVPGVDPKVAKTIVSDPEYKAAVSQVAVFANAPLDEDGTIVEEGEYVGLTPWQAYNLWLTGNLDPKKGRTREALTKQYRTYLNAVGGK